MEGRSLGRCETALLSAVKGIRTALKGALKGAKTGVGEYAIQMGWQKQQHGDANERQDNLELECWRC